MSATETPMPGPMGEDGDATEQTLEGSASASGSALPEGVTILLEIPLPVACGELVKITDKLIKVHGRSCKMTMQQVGDKLRFCKPNHKLTDAGL